MKKWIIPIVGMVIIGSVLIFAAAKGIDGTLLATGCSLIAAIATGGTIKVWGSLKAKGIDLKIGQEKK